MYSTIMIIVKKPMKERPIIIQWLRIKSAADKKNPKALKLTIVAIVATTINPRNKNSKAVNNSII